MRQARPSDGPAVAELYREAARAGFALAYVNEILDARIADDIADGLGLRVVAERQSEVVGFLKLEPGEYASLSRTGRLQLMVRQDLHGKGIGAELLRYATTWADGGALDRIEIYVRETNERAIALYKRFGFTEEGRLRMRVRRTDGARIDDLVLGRLCGREVA